MSDAPYEILASRYELHRQLATGGTADVFLARDQLLNRPVAVKILNETLSKDEAFVQRLRQEAQVVASLNHQNIVGVFDQGEHEGAPFIVMEYVDGQSLAEILRNEGQLEPDRAAEIAIDIAAALDAAHRQGMVHMDVKPGNVLVTNEGQVKLADFGIAKALNAGSETDLTIENGMVMGTATYLSPEQAQGHKVGPRSDVYSLAVVLYEMLSGRAPFVADSADTSAADIARQHVEDKPRSLRNMGVDIAQSLEAITLKGLSKSVDHRYPSVRDFASDLKRYLGGAHKLTSGAATPTRPVTGRSTPPEDPTEIIPVAQPATVGAAAVGATATATVAATTAAPAAASVAPSQPAVGQTVIESQPIVIRSDDTWKRNVLFFMFFIILLVLLGFLLRSLWAVVGGDAVQTQTESSVPIEAEVTVESFINLEQAQAEALIEQLNLVPIITAAANSDTPEGRVFAQDPPAGAIVEEGSTIAITISEAEGQLEVPTLIELTREEAERQLARNGFNFDVVEVDHPTVPADTVIRQEPAPGVTQRRGAVVFFEVSLGQSERTVPELAGSEFAAALNQLSELDFRTEIVEEASEEIEEGLVLRTDPEAGSLLRGGEIVTIFQSTGIALVPVPSVVGLLPDTARQQLVASGFEVEIDFEPAANPNDINRVLAQSPDANIDQREGEIVRIVVGAEPGDELITNDPANAGDDGATTVPLVPTDEATTTDPSADGGNAEAPADQADAGNGQADAGDGGAADAGDAGANDGAADAGDGG